MARIIAATAATDYVLGTCFRRPQWFKPLCLDEQLHTCKDSLEAANKEDTELCSFSEYWVLRVVTSFTRAQNVWKSTRTDLQGTNKYRGFVQGEKCEAQIWAGKSMGIGQEWRPTAGFMMCQSGKLHNCTQLVADSRGWAPGILKPAKREPKLPLPKS